MEKEENNTENLEKFAEEKQEEKVEEKKEEKKEEKTEEKMEGNLLQKGEEKREIETSVEKLINPSEMKRGGSIIYEQTSNFLEGLDQISLEDIVAVRLNQETLTKNFEIIKNILKDHHKILKKINEGQREQDIEIENLKNRAEKSEKDVEKLQSENKELRDENSHIKNEQNALKSSQEELKNENINLKNEVSSIKVILILILN